MKIVYVCIWQNENIEKKRPKLNHLASSLCESWLDNFINVNFVDFFLLSCSCVWSFLWKTFLLYFNIFRKILQKTKIDSHVSTDDALAVDYEIRWSPRGCYFFLFSLSRCKSILRTAEWRRIKINEVGYSRRRNAFFNWLTLCAHFRLTMFRSRQNWLHIRHRVRQNSLSQSSLNKLFF